MIIALANHKGGVSKTTTSTALWEILPNTLGVDVDPQGTFSLATNADEDTDNNMFSVFNGICTVEDAIQTFKKGAIIPSSPRISEIMNFPPISLSSALEKIRDRYEYIIVDTPPALSPITLEVFIAADVIVIPTLPELYPLKGLKQMGETIQEIRAKDNPKLKIAGLLLTHFDPRSPLHKDMCEIAKEMAEGMGTRVFKTTIRHSRTVANAQAMGKSIFESLPCKKVAEDYLSFIEELRKEIE